MASATLTRRAENLHSIHKHQTTDDEDTHQRKHHYFRRGKSETTPTRALSCDQTDVSSTKTSNNRFQHLCSRLRRRFTLKDYRTRSEDRHDSVSVRRSIRFGNYKSFSSTTDEPLDEIEWPDFEKVYESIPSCLINALPGLNDFSIGDNRNDNTIDLSNVLTDPSEQCSIERMNLFLQCKRGKNFRRNALCLKIDKTQYSGQLDTFIQQLMVEKLMRIWT